MSKGSYTGAGRVQVADRAQVEEAAGLRFQSVPKGDPDRSIINEIIHSADVTPQNAASNPFYDPSKSYDPNVQKELDRISSKHH